MTASASKRELLGLLYTGLIGVLFFSGLLLLPPGPAAGLSALPSVSATATIQPSPTRTGGTIRTPTRAGTIPPPLTATHTRTPTNSPTVAPTRTCLPTGTIVPSPSQGTGRNVLSDVVVISPDDVWAVGAYGDFDDAQTITLHWDGSTWAIVPSPNADADSSHLQAVSAVSANDVWAVGFSQEGMTYSTLIMHWNGSAWTIVPSPNTGSPGNYLYGIDAISSTNVWAVGSHNPGVDNQSMILHWNGSAWSLLPLPPIDDASGLYSVEALSANDIWAVGWARVGQEFRSLALHWNGSQWSESPSPMVGPGMHTLNDVSAVAADDVWAVGYTLYGWPAHTLVQHWDGTQWSVVPSPNFNNNWNNNLEGVVAVSANNVWAVGRHETGQGTETSQTLVMQWDGLTWGIVPSPNTGPTGNMLFKVAAAPGNTIWAVGRAGYYTESDTLVERFVDGCVVSTAVPTGTHATAVPTATTAHHTPVPLTSTPHGTHAHPTSTPHSAPSHTVVASPTACSVAFVDTPPDSTFYPYVMCLACRSILGGYADNTFRPNNDITRGQIAKIVSNSAGFTEGAGPQVFEDVPPGSTFYDWVNRLSNRGIMGGYACGGVGEPCGTGNLPYFRPNSNATRGQLSKIVSEAAGFGEEHTSQTFEDVPVGSTFYIWIERLVDRGIMGGYACGGAGEPCGVENRPYFRPSANVTRGQAAKIDSNTFFPGCNTP